MVASKIPIYNSNLKLKNLPHIVLDPGYNTLLSDKRSDNGLYCF